MEEKDGKKLNRDIAYNNISVLMAAHENLRENLIDTKKREGAFEVYSALDDAIRRALHFEAEYL